MTAKILLAGTVLSSAATLVTVFLKLTNQLHWSWWSVLSPATMWFGLVFIWLVLAIVLVSVLAGKEEVDDEF